MSTGLRLCSSGDPLAGSAYCASTPPEWSPAQPPFSSTLGDVPPLNLGRSATSWQVSVDANGHSSEEGPTHLDTAWAARVMGFAEESPAHEVAARAAGAATAVLHSSLNEDRQAVIDMLRRDAACLSNRMLQRGNREYQERLSKIASRLGYQVLGDGTFAFNPAVAERLTQERNVARMQAALHDGTPKDIINGGGVG